MKHIRSIKRLIPAKPNGVRVVFMHGYGCRLWQAVRLLSMLQKEGYEVLAIDLKKIFENTEPEALGQMMDETEPYVADFLADTKEFIFVGVSIGALTLYNLMKRNPNYKNLLAITGGDIRHLPERAFLRKKWSHVPKDEIDKHWEHLNMYDTMLQLKDKKMYMLLPKRDKVIDPEVVVELSKDLATRNQIELVITNGGHYHTGLAYTVFQPKQVLKIMHNYFGL